MRVIIILNTDDRPLRPLTLTRPRALLHVAGSTVLGHMLHAMAVLLAGEVIFVTGDDGAEIEAWMGAHYPDLVARYVPGAKPTGYFEAILLCRDCLQNDAPVIVATDLSIVEADYLAISGAAASRQAEAMLLVKEHADISGFGQVATGPNGIVTELASAQHSVPGQDTLVGIAWHRSSRQLLRLASQASPQTLPAESRLYFAAANQAMIAAGAKVATFPAFQWSDTSSLTGLLQTNTRLLSVGLHSADAIERSYAEDFTVLPPVFLHPDARVENAVIGPYASIGAGARISNAVIRHSVVDAGAGVENCVLDGSLVGESARVVGHPKSLVIAAESRVELG